MGYLWIVGDGSSHGKCTHPFPANNPHQLRRLVGTTGSSRSKRRLADRLELEPLRPWHGGLERDGRDGVLRVGVAELGRHLHAALGVSL